MGRLKKGDLSASAAMYPAAIQPRSVWCCRVAQQERLLRSHCIVKRDLEPQPRSGSRVGRSCAWSCAWSLLLRCLKQAVDRPEHSGLGLASQARTLLLTRYPQLSPGAESICIPQSPPNKAQPHHVIASLLWNYEPQPEVSALIRALPTDGCCWRDKAQARPALSSMAQSAQGR
jgi:hypothetical protein